LMRPTKVNFRKTAVTITALGEQYRASSAPLNIPNRLLSGASLLPDFMNDGQECLSY
jgi:hypothetical protein